MPFYDKGNVRIRYEEVGAGFLNRLSRVRVPPGAPHFVSRNAMRSRQPVDYGQFDSNRDSNPGKTNP